MLKPGAIFVAKIFRGASDGPAVDKAGREAWREGMGTLMQGLCFLQRLCLAGCSRGSLGPVVLCHISRPGCASWFCRVARSVGPLAFFQTPRLQEEAVCVTTFGRVCDPHALLCSQHAT